MKLLKGIFYFFFSLFFLLIGFTFFAERLFFPSKNEIEERLKHESKYSLQFKKLDNNGFKIGYAAIGNPSKQKIILVHGSPGSWSNFFKVLDHDELYENFYLIAPDRYGYGMTDGEHGEGDLNIQADQVRLFCSPSADGKKPILVGHSMGGPIVINSAIRFGDQLSGVISVAGSFDAELEPNEWFRGLYKVFPMNLFFNRDLKASNDELFIHKNELNKMKSFWKTITCKVTIIQGGKDNLVDPGNLEFAKQQLGDKAHYVFIPNENHLIPFGDHPEVIFEAIEKMAE